MLVIKIKLILQKLNNNNYKRKRYLLIPIVDASDVNKEFMKVLVFC